MPCFNHAAHCLGQQYGYDCVQAFQHAAPLTAAVTLRSTEESTHPRVTWVKLELVVVWSVGCPSSSKFPI